MTPSPGPATGPLRTSPLWLSHHHEPDSERCVHLAGRSVCRRCLTLYPTVVVTALVSLSFWRPNGLPAAVFVSLVLLPFLGEWTAEHAGLVGYSPRRQTAVSLLAGLGGGVALAVHLRHPFDPWVTGPVALCAGSALLVTLATRSRRTNDGGDAWLERFEQGESERAQRLQALLESRNTSTDQPGV